MGETFWDTSDFYGNSEDLIGKWFARTGKRDDIFLATKFGGVHLEDSTFSFQGDAAFVAEACETSLKCLRTDHIDLWYPHRLDGSTPVEHIVAEMVKMKEQGKIRYLGLCEISAEMLRRAYAVHPVTAVQVEHSPFTPGIEDPKIGLLNACRELGVAIVAYCPLSRGLLSGQINHRNDFAEGDVRQYYPRFSEQNFPKNLAIVAELEKTAKDMGCTPGQLTLAWLLSQGDDIFPIPGTKTPKCLTENFNAATAKLNPDEVAHIRSLVNNASIGARYAPEHILALFADTLLPDEWSAGDIKARLRFLGMDIE